EAVAVLSMTATGTLPPVPTDPGARMEEAAVEAGEPAAATTKPTATGPGAAEAAPAAVVSASSPLTPWWPSVIAKWSGDGLETAGRAARGRAVKPADMEEVAES